MLDIFLLSVDEQYAGKVEYIYNSYHDDMMRFALARLKKARRDARLCDAEDAVQNSFVKIIKYIDKIDGNCPERKLRAYVFTIVSNEVSDMLSDNKDYDDIDDCELSLTEEDTGVLFEQKCGYDEIVKAINDMDEKYRTVLFLRFTAEMTVPEISDILGTGEKTVYTRLNRGKKLLIKKLKKGDSEG